MNQPPAPLLTIAVPVFNGEAALAPMLVSLDSQDWNLFEVRFSDDGSADDTCRVLDEFAAKHPGHVFVESHENIGPGPCRNRLLAQARGEWLWFCDADDELAPGAIARIAEILKVPEGYDLVCILPVGKMESEPTVPKKKPFAERAWFNGFGKTEETE